MKARLVDRLRLKALKGYKTYLYFTAVLLLGIVDLLDPGILSTALGLGVQGKSAVIIGLAVGGFILRKFTTAKAGPVLPVKK